MTHLKIEQNTSGTEEVTASIINKLYNIVSSGTLDNTSNLQGRLHSTSAYQRDVDYLTTQFNNLYITTIQYLAFFTDPEVMNVIRTNYGDVTTQQFAAITNIGTIFQNNTSIQTFNELNQSGITSLAQNAFYGCTNLREITIPQSCTSVGNNAFAHCSSLLHLDLSNVQLNVGSNCLGVFYNCSALQSIILGDCAVIGNKWATYDGRRGHFTDCTQLTTVDVKSISTICTYNNGTFRNCPSMTTFILRSTTVPSVEDNNIVSDMTAFGGENVTLYVPKTALTDYRTAWPAISNKILSIEDDLQQTSTV